MSNINVGSIASSSMLNFRQQSALSAKSATANSLLGSLNIDDKNIAASISLSDYGQIKNGSYGKLVSAYYNKMKTETKTSSAKTDNAEKSDDSKKTSYEKSINIHCDCMLECGDVCYDAACGAIARRRVRTCGETNR